MISAGRIYCFYSGKTAAKDSVWVCSRRPPLRVARYGARGLDLSSPRASARQLSGYPLSSMSIALLIPSSLTEKTGGHAPSRASSVMTWSPPLSNDAPKQFSASLVAVNSSREWEPGRWRPDRLQHHLPRTGPCRQEDPQDPSLGAFRPGLATSGLTSGTSKNGARRTTLR